MCFLHILSNINQYLQSVSNTPKPPRQLRPVAARNRDGVLRQTLGKKKRTCSSRVFVGGWQVVFLGAKWLNAPFFVAAHFWGVDFCGLKQPMMFRSSSNELRFWVGSTAWWHQTLQQKYSRYPIPHDPKSLGLIHVQVDSCHQTNMDEGFVHVWSGFVCPFDGWFSGKVEQMEGFHSIHGFIHCFFFFCFFFFFGAISTSDLLFDSLFHRIRKLRKHSTQHVPWTSWMAFCQFPNQLDFSTQYKVTRFENNQQFFLRLELYTYTVIHDRVQIVR